MPEKRETTTFGQPPYVHPEAPQTGIDYAAAHRRALEVKRQRNPLPKTQIPVAGGPPPPIPHLTGAPQRAGMTLSEHALAERGDTPNMQAPGFVEPPSHIAPNQAAPSALGLLPTDELPPAAHSDPGFVQGTGSHFAANQPQLAAKYGIMRRGRHIPAQQLTGRPSQLRPETLRDLEDLTRLQKKQEQVAVPPQPESSEMGKAAGNVGSPNFTDSDKKEIQESLHSLDEFDFDQYRQSLTKDILNNEEQKKIIEARLQPMDVGDLISNMFLIQRVPIIPHKFVVEFTTLDAETDLALKRLIMEDSASVTVSDRYYLDKFGLMSVAAVIHKINDKPFGDITDSKGNFDDAKFRTKFSRVLKLPMPMVTSIGANAFWFDLRVRKLFRAEEVGNG